jgi:hypothetical protein
MFPFSRFLEIVPSLSAVRFDGLAMALLGCVADASNHLPTAGSPIRHNRDEAFRNLGKAHDDVKLVEKMRLTPFLLV